MANTRIDWIDERLGLSTFLRSQAARPVGKHVSLLYCFGGLTLFFFALQMLTGMLLSVYYVATPGQAHASVEYIQSDVTFGWLIRGLHHWGSSGMVVMIGAHLLRVFFTGAYKPPRELNWVVGVVLLAVTLAFGFTGYLLPWDQKAYWATEVSTKSVSVVPLVGDFILKFVRGGADLTAVTLARFYAAHALFLPGLMVALLVAHFLMIRKQGIAGPL